MRIREVRTQPKRTGSSVAGHTEFSVTADGHVRIRTSHGHSVRFDRGEFIRKVGTFCDDLQHRALDELVQLGLLKETDE